MRKLLFILYLFFVVSASARNVQLLSDGWTIYPSYDVTKNPARRNVNIPHTWNVEDVFNGMKYDRSTYVYERLLPIVEDNKRVFVRFGAVNSSAEIAVNQQYIGNHYGGYTAFCFEITDMLIEKENKLTVVASNAYRTDVAPLAGDFNIYGGITRPVSLIITGLDCISPLDCASSGVYIHQKSVSQKAAEIDVETIVSLTSKKGCELKVTIIDAQGNIVAGGDNIAVDGRNHLPLKINNPRLWNGRKDPYLYKVKVELLQNGNPIDAVEERMGLRSFCVDNERGFFLNGEPMDLYGVCRHEEFVGTMSLYNEKAMADDARIIYEMGATGVRFVHYPHSEYDAWQYDSLGIVVWSELNLAGPGGYGSPGYIKNPILEKNVMQNLEEMIKQNYNSPSICFWSLCNELSFKYDEPTTFLKQLNAKAKALDPQRLTTLAICYDQVGFQHITDVIGWNKYFGWYNNSKGSIGEFMDNAHIQAGQQPIGLCEYGAAASINQHGFENKVSNKIHYEEYQARVHEDNWMQMRTRPYVWCKFIWQYADNPSSIRNEGDMMGMNDKGVVTFDRKVHKDSYFFYQANWSDKPMLYISSRRFVERTDSITDIKLYTNQNYATLYLNGKKIGKGKNDGMGRVIFKNVTLERGKNLIEVKSAKELHDSCVWILSDKNRIKKYGEDEVKTLDGAV